ncbi:MAG: 2-succinyl-5-enolpyruvyl-6-hydroxy-3-cyclohexene-1-carboxylic-acid synthase [Actinomycetia bacterium]|nr:2-succinyl-5-enolpyruvyl-6-hydroxy-3-cyclohexene-1-carboxylic-acid synthase [Actinomycetes bacterium]
MTRAPEDVQATFCATLVDQWVRMGLRHAVVAPGSRSTPMALALAERSDVALQIAHDERSAAFIALGIGLATHVPAALLCTSGTAATHFHAAVVEADLSGVPLLVLTADRPPELQGIGAPQTINQVRLYGDVVRCFADPGVAEGGEASTWREMAAHWWALATGRDAGPVHVNLQFREPLVGVAGELPPAIALADGPGELPSQELATVATLLTGKRGLIIAGGGVSDAASVAALANMLQWPVFADPRSGCRGLAQAVSCFDAILRATPFAAAHRPEVVLHLGEPPASKVLGQWLQAGSAVHVHVHEQRRTIDPLRLVTHRITCDTTSFCNELSALLSPATETTWLADWRRAEQLGQQTIDATVAARSLSEPQVARLLSDGAQLVVSSSMPVRDVEWFGQSGSTTRVYSNRGANGIDGVIATAIGVAVGSGDKTVVLLGDVAFCHDQSSLTALAARRLPITIVVVDNDGGGIFSFLPQATTLPSERFEQLFGTPHGTDIVAVARAHGLGATTATTLGELRAALADAAVTVVRVASDRTRNVVEHNRINAAVAAAIS